jgi:hypothetical protein
MKKVIQFLIILILLAILSLIIIFVFNPANLRAKIIGGIVNSYLENNVNLSEQTSLSGSTSTTSDHPLLNDNQEEMLKNLGIDVSKLPTEITPAMQDCFVEKLGSDRTTEIVNGATPSALEIMKASSCL